jgi:hypothetical protein
MRFRSNLATIAARVKQINTIYRGISVENAASCTGVAANRKYTRTQRPSGRNKEEEEIQQS